jgi:putative ABC transport system permease protein
MHELRYALRMLRKQPGISVIAILLLALGIDGNTAIFSVIIAVVLNPLAFPKLEQIGSGALLPTWSPARRPALVEPILGLRTSLTQA